MHNNLWSGSPRSRKSRFGFRAKPNGNMPRVAAAELNFGGAISFEADTANCKGCNQPTTLSQPLEVIELERREWSPDTAGRLAQGSKSL